jgi:protein TonB
MTIPAISGFAESEIQLRRLLRGYTLSLLFVAALHAGVWMLTRKAPVETPVIVPPMVDVELITEPKVASASPSAAPPAPRPATPPVRKAEAPPKPKPKPKPPVKPAEKPVPHREPEKPVERAEAVRPTPQPPAPSASPAQGTPSSSSSAASSSAASRGTGSGAGKGSGSGTSDKVTPAHDAGYLHNPKPKYPAVAVARNWEGLVRLRVYVLPNGTAGQVLLQQSSGHESLDEAALDVVQRWRFVPAKRGEQAIASWVVVPLVFKLNSGR